MANSIQKIVGPGELVSQRIIAGSLKPEQMALYQAWQRGQLPAPAQKFMGIVRDAVQKTGRSRDLDKVTASQIPPNLAKKITALTVPENVQSFAAELLSGAPDAGRSSVAELVRNNTLLPEQALAVSQAFGDSRGYSNAATLMRVLKILPFKVAQSILDERNAAINAFLKAWTEDLALNAELDAKAAKKAAELAAQAQLTQRHGSETARANLALNVRKQNRLHSERRLDATSSDFAKMLLMQRQTVYEAAVGAMGEARIRDTSPAVERSSSRAERGSSVVFHVAPELNVATLDALDEPLEGLGPHLGTKRGHLGT